MRKISVWAKHHAGHARIVIVIIKIVLLITAVYSGKLIYECGIALSPVLAILSALLIIAAALIHPEKSLPIDSKKKLYALRKGCEFTLAFATFIFVSVQSNNLRVSNESASFNSAIAASFIKGHTPTAEEIINSLKYRSKNSLTKEEKRILKKEFFKQAKIYARAKINGDKSGAKAGLIILTIIGAVGLSMLLAGLACSIACGGADGLAVLVAVVGLSGIIWGTIVTIKAIKKHYDNRGGAGAGMPANSN